MIAVRPSVSAQPGGGVRRHHLGLRDHDHGRHQADDTGAKRDRQERHPTGILGHGPLPRALRIGPQDHEPSFADQDEHGQIPGRDGARRPPKPGRQRGEAQDAGHGSGSPG